MPPSTLIPDLPKQAYYKGPQNRSKTRMHTPYNFLKSCSECATQPPESYQITDAHSLQLFEKVVGSMLPSCGPFLEEGGGGRGAGEERDRRREMERSNLLPDWLGRPGWLPGLPDLAGLARLAWLALPG